MAEQIQLVCDKCGAFGKGVQRITLITEDGRASFDLCVKCRKPLTEILDLLAQAPQRRVGRPSGLVKSQTSRVYRSPADIPGKRKGGKPKKPAPMGKKP